MNDNHEGNVYEGLAYAITLEIIALSIIVTILGVIRIWIS